MPALIAKDRYVPYSPVALGTLPLLLASVNVGISLIALGELHHNVTQGLEQRVTSYYSLRIILDLFRKPVW